MSNRSGPGAGTHEGTGDARFVGSIPEVYERLLVPLIFAEPATRLAQAVADLAPAAVLETAAGTGVVTRELRSRLPEADLVATDLQEPMLQIARQQPGLAGVRWQQADAVALDFPDASFDVVVCQFGVMFFPDRVAGYAEARRVLRPSGAFVFNVWDNLAANPVVEVVERAVASAVTQAPPEFLARTPYGCSDPSELEGDLATAGFTAVVQHCSGTNRGIAADVATAFCEGTPLRGEIEAHPVLDLETARAAAESALLERYGTGVIEAPSSWLQVVAEPRG